MAIFFSREAVILGTSSLLLILNYHYPIYPEPQYACLSALFYLFVIPIAIVQFFEDDLKKYGFKLGRWPFRKDVTVLAVLFVLILQYLTSLLPQFQEYYSTKIPSTGYLVLYLIFFLGIYQFAWEFFFRGYLLFGLKEKFGWLSIVIQSVPFALVHIGKPPLEAVASVFVGLLFGYIAYRSESFIPTFIIHWLMSVLLIVFVSLA